MAGNLKRISLYLQAAFYTFAGLNHFINPDFYSGLIPDYLPWHTFINFAGGLIEIVLGVSLLFQKTRKWSALGIVLMLISFIPSHWHFIQSGSCIEGGLCVAPWIGWFRLLIVHPLLILWAVLHMRSSE